MVRIVRVGVIRNWDRFQWLARALGPKSTSTTIGGIYIYIYSNNVEIIYVLRYIDIGNWCKVPAVANLLVLGKLFFPIHSPSRQCIHVGLKKYKKGGGWTLSSGQCTSDDFEIEHHDKH